MNRTNSSRLDDFIDNPKKAIWVLALPTMGGFIIHALYNIVDAIFIGQLSPQALAASTFVIALVFVAVAFGIGFSTGVTATVAQAVGRRDQKEAERLASNARDIHGHRFALGTTHYACFGSGRRNRGSRLAVF